MSHVSMHSISIRDGKVYTISAHSETGTAVYREEEDAHLTAQYQKGGLHAVLKTLGEKVFLGTVILRPHNCRLADYLQHANNLIQPPLSLFLDADHAGEFIATVAEHMYTETVYSPVEELRKLESLRSDPKATLEICKNNPRAFNFSETNVRRDPKLAKRYIKQCALNPRFVFPSYFIDDAEIAMAALKIDGRIFSQLGKSLRNNKRVALFAYNSGLQRPYHATNPIHLGSELLEDLDFLCELCSTCPDLAVEHTPFILLNADVAETWLLYNRDTFANKHLLPRDVLHHTKILRALYLLAGEDKDRLSEVDLFVFQANP